MTLATSMQRLQAAFPHNCSGLPLAWSQDVALMRGVVQPAATHRADMTRSLKTRTDRALTAGFANVRDDQNPRYPGWVASRLLSPIDRRDRTPGRRRPATGGLRSHGPGPLVCSHLRAALARLLVRKDTIGWHDVAERSVNHATQLAAFPPSCGRRHVKCPAAPRLGQLLAASYACRATARTSSTASGSSIGTATPCGFVTRRSRARANFILWVPKTPVRRESGLSDGFRV